MVRLLAALTLVLASIRAPLSSSSLTMLAFPLFDATWRGVMSFCHNKKGKTKSQMHNLDQKNKVDYM